MDTGLREAINRTKVYLFQAIKKPDKTGFFIDHQRLMIVVTIFAMYMAVR